MKKWIALAAIVTLVVCLYAGGTMHEDPVVGENNTVTLRFYAQTLVPRDLALALNSALKITGYPYTENDAWVHGHQNSQVYGHVIEFLDSPAAPLLTDIAKAIGSSQALKNEFGPGTKDRPRKWDGKDVQVQFFLMQKSNGRYAPLSTTGQPDFAATQVANTPWGTLIPAHRHAGGMSPRPGYEGPAGEREAVLNAMKKLTDKEHQQYDHLRSIDWAWRFHIDNPKYYWSSWADYPTKDVNIPAKLPSVRFPLQFASRQNPQVEVLMGLVRVMVGARKTCEAYLTPCSRFVLDKDTDAGVPIPTDLYRTKYACKMKETPPEWGETVRQLGQPR